MRNRNFIKQKLAECFHVSRLKTENVVPMLYLTQKKGFRKNPETLGTGDDCIVEPIYGPIAVILLVQFC